MHDTPNHHPHMHACRVVLHGYGELSCIEMHACKQLFQLLQGLLDAKHASQNGVRITQLESIWDTDNYESSWSGWRSLIIAERRVLHSSRLLGVKRMPVHCVVSMWCIWPILLCMKTTNLSSCQTMYIVVFYHRNHAYITTKTLSVGSPMHLSRKPWAVRQLER